MRSIAFMLLLGSMAAADHLPETLIAKGKGETQLAGIDVYRSHWKDLQNKFGKPSQYETFPKTEDSAEAIWSKNGSIIHAYMDADSVAYSVRLSGSPRADFTTGRGLALGQTVENLKRLYGRRFLLKGNLITVQWQDGTEMRATLKDGKIISLVLVAQVE